MISRSMVCLVFMLSSLSAHAMARAVVIAPLTDVRRQPLAPTQDHSDDLQETQLLFGETVQILESSGAWKRIAAVEQPEFSHHTIWEGYPGWVRGVDLGPLSDDGSPTALVAVRWAPLYPRRAGKPIGYLPLGSRVRVSIQAALWVRLLRGINGHPAWMKTADLRPAPIASSRQAVLATAELMKGDPYVWGGLSPHDPTGKALLSGVDCSGLVHLSFRVNGQQIPRDALEQYMRAQKVQRAELLPGDLIFSAAAATPTKVTHVMLYAGNAEAVEAPQTGLPVRWIRIIDKFGVPFDSIESGQTVNGRVIYFGRLFGQSGSGDLPASAP